MKKGHASYLMLVYGFAILVVTLLLATLMFSVRNPFSGKEDIGSNSDVEINLLNYARTPATINGLSFTIADLIVYSYSKNDFSDLDKYTKELLNSVYGGRCSYDVAYYLDGSNLHTVISNDFIGDDIDTAEMSIPGFNGNVVDVRLTQIC